jgi:hypothetical protein
MSFSDSPYCAALSHHTSIGLPNLQLWDLTTCSLRVTFNLQLTALLETKFPENWCWPTECVGILSWRHVARSWNYTRTAFSKHLFHWALHHSCCSTFSRILYSELHNHAGSCHSLIAGNSCSLMGFLWKQKDTWGSLQGKNLHHHCVLRSI